MVAGVKLGSGFAHGMSPPPQFWWLQVNVADDPQESITIEASAMLKFVAAVLASCACEIIWVSSTRLANKGNARSATSNHPHNSHSDVFSE